MTVYPSIAATGLGRMLGALYNSIPLKIGGVKLSYLLFVLPTAPLGLLLYALTKMTGESYELTNRAVRKWKMALGTKSRLAGEVALSDVQEVYFDQQSGQEFYNAANLEIEGGGGLLLSGVQRADVFRQTILKARDARRYVQASLDVIAARQPA